MQKKIPVVLNKISILNKKTFYSKDVLYKWLFQKENSELFCLYMVYQYSRGLHSSYVFYLIASLG